MNMLKRNSSLLGLVIAVALAFAAAPSSAQTTTTTTTTATNSHPVYTSAPRTPKKLLKFHGEVFNATSGSIVLRTPDKPMDIHTFSYSPDVKAKMLEILNKGGYQPGDKVTVKYAPGTTVALHLSGRPSKRKLPKSTPTSS
jgi:hypothetical protein